MKRVWFNPQITTPTDGIKYYVRVVSAEWFPHFCIFDAGANRFLDLVNGNGYLLVDALRVSEFP
jgi:hypothetical protein